MAGGNAGFSDEDYSWLVGTPASDGNFKAALERASEPTIRAAVKHFEELGGSQGKVLALRRRLRAMGLEEKGSDREALDTLARQERSTGFEVATLQGERALEDHRDAVQIEREGLIAQTHEMIGRIQGFKAIAEFADVGRLVWLRQVKDSKIYRDLPNVGTWDKFCNYVGLSRQKVDEDLSNLSAFGEKFLTTVGSFSIGYRELRKLRQLTADGSVVIEAECIVIGEEKIPINEDHAEDLQVAIERVLEDRSKLNQRVEKLEKDLDGVVKEETKGLKAEVAALVKEVRRLKPFDPEEKDLSKYSEQVEAIKESVLSSVALMSRFVADERVQQEPVLMGQVEGHLQTIELSLTNLRRTWEQAISIFEA